MHDFSYTYTHEDPFPALEKISDEVDVEFRRIFDEIGTFLRSS
jgi:hypothetical protein